jgi:ectoine utilization protein EutC
MDVQLVTEAQLRAVMTLERGALEAITDGFRRLSQGEVTQPPIMRIDIPEHHGEVDIKSAYIKGLNSFAVKLSSGFFENYKRGLPSASGMMVLLDAETGVPIALLLDNGYLTDLRTALAGAVAAELLAKKSISTVGVIGSGAQARYQVRALRLVRDFEQILVWSRNAERAEAYSREMWAELGLPVHIKMSAREVVEASDIVVTTTPAKRPIIQKDWLHPGLHLTAMGSDAEAKQELSADVLAAADILACDSRLQCARLGEIHHALDAGTLASTESAAELGEIIVGRRLGREDDAQITVCDLTGTGMQDTVIARLAVERLASKDNSAG